MIPRTNEFASPEEPTPETNDSRGAVGHVLIF